MRQNNEEAEECINTCNWEKVRDAPLLARIENASFLDEFNCNVCDSEVAKNNDVNIVDQDNKLYCS